MAEGFASGIDMAAVAKIGIFLAIIYGMSAIFTFTQHYIMATVTLKMSRRMRGELSEKINRVPQKYFNTTSQGDILSRITNDVSTLQQGLTNSLPTIISAATQFTGCLIMMFVTEWRLALTSLGITLVGLLLIVLIMSRSQKYFAARQQSLGELNGYIEEMMDGQKVVKVFTHEEESIENFNRLNDQLFHSADNANKFGNILMPVNAQIGNISYVLCALVGGVLALNGIGGFTLGKLASFLTYNKSFSQTGNHNPVQEGRQPCVTLYH